MPMTKNWPHGFPRHLIVITSFQTHLSYPDAPCISQTLSVTFSDSHTQSLRDAVSLIGEVSMTGSLQIAELVEQPGAILVQWYDEVCVAPSWKDY